MWLSVLFQSPDPSAIFTDTLALMTNLGITDYVVGAIEAIIVLSVSAALLRFIR